MFGLGFNFSIFLEDFVWFWNYVFIFFPFYFAVSCAYFGFSLSFFFLLAFSFEFCWQPFHCSTVTWSPKLFVSFFRGSLASLLFCMFLLRFYLLTVQGKGPWYRKMEEILFFFRKKSTAEPVSAGAFSQ